MVGSVGRARGGAASWGVLCVVLATASATSADAGGDDEAGPYRGATRPAPPAADDRIGVGFDVRLGLTGGTLSAPGMVGVDLALEPFRALGLTAGIETNGLAVAPRVGAHLFPLRAFAPGLRWSPSLSASYAWMRYTRAADRLLGAFVPGLERELAEVGANLRLAGLSMHTGRVSVGVDYAGHDGLRFRLAVGRTMSIGRSRSPYVDGLVLAGYQSWTAELLLGWRG